MGHDLAHLGQIAALPGGDVHRLAVAQLRCPGLEREVLEPKEAWVAGVGFNPADRRINALCC